MAVSRDPLITPHPLYLAMRNDTNERAQAYRRWLDAGIAPSQLLVVEINPDLVAFLNDAHAKSVDLYLHQQGLDTSTPSGRMLFQMLGVFAEFERAMIRERILAGLRRTSKKSGRKPMAEDRVEAIKTSLQDGLGIRAAARLHRASPMTVTKIAREIIAA